MIINEVITGCQGSRINQKQKNTGKQQGGRRVILKTMIVYIRKYFFHQLILFLSEYDDYPRSDKKCAKRLIQRKVFFEDDNCHQYDQNVAQTNNYRVYKRQILSTQQKQPSEKAGGIQGKAYDKFIVQY